MAAFTLPLVYDKTFLVILRPGTQDESLSYQTKKVLAPFENALWGLILVIIFVAALLSVWFSDRPKAATRRQGDRRIMGMQQSRPVRRQRRKSAYARLALDSFLQKGLVSVERLIYYRIVEESCRSWVPIFYSVLLQCRSRARWRRKLTQSTVDVRCVPFFLFFYLNWYCISLCSPRHAGFGFFILIAVSAYVANLAAFLTLRTTGEVVNTMEGAVAAGAAICAHPAVSAYGTSIIPFFVLIHTHVY